MRSSKPPSTDATACPPPSSETPEAHDALALSPFGLLLLPVRTMMRNGPPVRGANDGCLTAKAQRSREGREGGRWRGMGACNRRKDGKGAEKTPKRLWRRQSGKVAPPDARPAKRGLSSLFGVFSAPFP